MFKSRVSVASINSAAFPKIKISVFCFLFRYKSYFCGRSTCTRTVSFQLFQGHFHSAEYDIFFLSYQSTMTHNLSDDSVAHCFLKVRLDQFCLCFLDFLKLNLKRSIARPDMCARLYVSLAVVDDLYLDDS